MGQLVTCQHPLEIPIGPEVLAALILQGRDRPQLDLAQATSAASAVCEFQTKPHGWFSIFNDSSDSSAIDALRTLESIPPTPVLLLLLLGNHDGQTLHTVPDTMPAQRSTSSLEHVGSVGKNVARSMSHASAGGTLRILFRPGV